MVRNREASPTICRSDEIASQLEAQRLETAEAERRLGELTEERRGRLLTVDDAGLRKHDDLIAAAKRRLDRAEAWFAKLSAEHQAALDDEANEPKRKRYAVAAKAADAARHRLATEYPRLAAEMASLLTALVEAGQQASAANEALPRGVEPIPCPERAVRDVAALAEEVVSERQVERWVYALSGDLLDEQTAARVRAGEGCAGYLPSEGLGHPARVERRSFIERRVLKAAPSRHIVDGIIAEVRLPGLKAGDATLWPPQAGGNSERVESVTYEPAVSALDAEAA